MAEVVDLPQPDSPTRPSVSPRPTVKLIPSTARNGAAAAALPLRSTLSSTPPPWRGYSLTRSSTTINGSLAGMVRTTDAGAVTFGKQAAQVDAVARRRPHQLLRVGVGRRLEDRRRRGGLDHLAVLHHHHPVAVGGGQAQIVGDEDGRHAALAGEVDDQIHDRLLRGHVEAGGGLVGDQELRAAAKARAMTIRWHMPPESSNG